MPPEEPFASTPPSETLWTISDVARYFGCTVRHVHNLQASGLPYFHLGRLVRFDPTEVRAYLQTNRRIAATKARHPARPLPVHSQAVLA
jgi:excisionase family DNA binding protein